MTKPIDSVSPELIKQILAALDRNVPYTDLIAKYGDLALDAIPELVTQHKAYAEVRKHIPTTMLRWEVATKEGTAPFHTIVAREEADLRQSRYYLFKAPTTPWHVIKAEKHGINAIWDKIEDNLTVGSAGAFVNFAVVPDLDDPKIVSSKLVKRIKQLGASPELSNKQVEADGPMEALRGMTLTAIEMSPRVYERAGNHALKLSDIHTIDAIPITQWLQPAPTKKTEKKLAQLEELLKEPQTRFDR